MLKTCMCSTVVWLLKSPHPSVFMLSCVLFVWVANCCLVIVQPCNIIAQWEGLRKLIQLHCSHILTMNVARLVMNIAISIWVWMLYYFSIYSYVYIEIIIFLYYLIIYLIKSLHDMHTHALYKLVRVLKILNLTYSIYNGSHEMQTNRLAAS